MHKILIINQYSYPPSQKTNSRRHFDLFKNFSKKEYNIDIICGSFIHDRKEQILDKKEKYRLVEEEGINYHILPGMSYKNNLSRMISMIQFYFKVLFFSKKLKEKPDLVYSSSPHPFNGLVGMRLAKKYKCPFIIEIRDLWPETWVSMGATTKKSLLYKVFAYIEKVLYKNADKIVTVLANKDYFTSIGVDEKKVELVSNGVDLEKYDISIKEESPIKFPSDKFNIVYTGKLGTANYIEIILDTAKEIKEEKIFFHIIGEGEKKEELIRKAKENGLENLNFYPPVPKTSIPSILKEASLVIQTLKNTNLYKYGISSNKIYEYFAAAKPIIFSGNAINDMVTEANAGITVDAGNIAKLKEAILSLYSMTDEERKVLGKNGRDYVEKNYDTKILSKKLENIIARLLEGKNV